MMKLKLIASTILVATASSSSVAGVVTVNTPAAMFGDNHLAANDIHTVYDFGYAQSYANAPISSNSAQGLSGAWYTFYVEHPLDLSVEVQTLSGTFSPGITVWASGNDEFDGGNPGFEEYSPLAGQTTPFAFNATGVTGAAGTQWMSEGFGGNLKETLAYAQSGPTATTTAWGELILHGVNDVSTTDTYEGGISGSVGSGFASLEFSDMQPGWYAAFVGGSNPASTAGWYSFTVSAVPEMETWLMMLAGMGILGWHLKKQQAEASSLST